MIKCRYFTCTLYQGTNSRGKVFRVFRLKASSEGEARNKFMDKFRWQYPTSYLVVECGSIRVGREFNSSDYNEYDDGEELEDEDEDDWEDEEDDFYDEEDEDYDDEYEEDYEDE